MSSPCTSPSKFHGLPWETWTNALHLAQAAPDVEEPPKPTVKTTVGVMKLQKFDMKMFGLCPEQDPFTVVVCDKCDMCIKPQAILNHLETRHSNNKEHLPQLFSDIVVPEKSLTKVVKAKVKNKKTNKEGGKSIGGVAPHPPMSLVLEAPILAATSKPLVVHTSLAGGPILLASAATPPKLKACHPPRKHAPIKEREYDSDKHCGVVSTETLKPCTWSLTCKSHTLSLRRAVIGRSKPFDQLLADHRQAKEALFKQKKSLKVKVQKSSVTPPIPTQNMISEPKKIINQKEGGLLGKNHDLGTVNPRLPRRGPLELNFEVTPFKQTYLSATHPSLVINRSERPSSQVIPEPVQGNTMVEYSLKYPKPISVSSLFYRYKLGGLMYTNRRMLVARQRFKFCLNRPGNDYRGSSSQFIGIPSTLSNVLSMSSPALRGVKRKIDQSNKPDKILKTLYMIGNKNSN